ncbi:MAG: hypothetical protein ACD_75C00024G0006 [uncultured bacterium]|nr:MAG: hypothetical protein ACD_75C00024G0006 [uncultured bacterium]
MPNEIDMAVVIHEQDGSDENTQAYPVNRPLCYNDQSHQQDQEPFRQGQFRT